MKRKINLNMQTLREAKRLFRFINTSKARFPAPKTALLFVRSF
jgi:hypothetical protein